MSSTRIAFIGTGNMGGPMALNLVKEGLNVTVYDVIPAATDTLVAAGAKSAPSIAEAVREADIVITMLPGDAQMTEAYTGASGIFAGAKKNALLIDCSTVSAALAQDMALRAKDQGLEMIDAPVSGGTAGAAGGTLTFMIGGEEKSIARAKPILEKMGKNLFVAGGHGAGQVVKMCNNMLLAITMIGTTEALKLGIGYSLDPKTISDIMVKSSGRNWVLELYNPVPGVMEGSPATRMYAGGFMTDLMVKDLGLSQAGAADKDVKTPLGAHALALYKKHSTDGNGKLDFSSIIAVEE